MVSRMIAGLGRSGLADWLMQRVSAVVMLIYVLIIAGFFVTHSHVTYQMWHHLFSPLWFKLLSLLVVICLLMHSWIGLWIVFTDYIKPVAVRLTVQTALVLFLLACLIWTVFVLWSM